MSVKQRIASLSAAMVLMSGGSPASGQTPTAPILTPETFKAAREHVDAAADQRQRICKDKVSDEVRARVTKALVYSEKFGTPYPDITIGVDGDCRAPFHNASGKVSEPVYDTPEKAAPAASRRSSGPGILQ